MLYPAISILLVQVNVIELSVTVDVHLSNAMDTVKYHQT